MGISIVSNFDINTDLPIDSRITAINSTVREAISYKYDGLKVFQLDTRISYRWNSPTSTWTVDISGNVYGSLLPGTGTNNYVPRWASHPDFFLENSDLFSINKQVGINTTNPKEAFQVSSNYSGVTAPPLVIHKGGVTLIAENWYYTGFDNAFDLTRGSSRIGFDNGSIILSSRPSNSLANAYSNSIYVSPIGLVGISTITPNINSPITINGSAIITSGSNLASQFKVDNTTTYLSHNSFLTGTFDGTNSPAIIKMSSISGGSNIVFGTTNNLTAPNNCVFISEIGVVKITPDSTLNQFLTAEPTTNTTWTNTTSLLNVAGTVVIGDDNNTSSFSAITTYYYSISSYNTVADGFSSYSGLPNLTTISLKTLGVVNSNSTITKRSLNIKPGLHKVESSGVLNTYVASDVLIAGGDITSPQSTMILRGGSLVLKSGASKTSTITPKITLYGNATSNNIGYNGGNISIVAGSGIGTFAVNSHGGNVFILGGDDDVDGNVILSHDGKETVGRTGIGTSTPRSLLDVGGDTTIKGNTKIYGYLDNKIKMIAGSVPLQLSNVTTDTNQTFFDIPFRNPYVTNPSGTFPSLSPLDPNYSKVITITENGQYLITTNVDFLNNTPVLRGNGGADMNAYIDLFNVTLNENTARISQIALPAQLGGHMSGVAIVTLSTGSQYTIRFSMNCSTGAVVDIYGDNHGGVEVGGYTSFSLVKLGAL
jgi:hypothetical protein